MVENLNNIAVFSGIGYEYDICTRGFLEELALSTLKVESAEGRNYHKFVNFHESYTRENVLF